MKSLRSDVLHYFESMIFIIPISPSNLINCLNCFEKSKGRWVFSEYKKHWKWKNAFWLAFVCILKSWLWKLVSLLSKNACRGYKIKLFTELWPKTGFLIRGAGNWNNCYSGSAVAPLVFLIYYSILNTEIWWSLEQQQFTEGFAKSPLLLVWLGLGEPKLQSTTWISDVKVSFCSVTLKARHP